jgi:hypothetical protein
MRRLLLLALLASFALPAAAQNCDTALEDASERYRSGYFDEAIERLTDCLDKNAFSSEERRRAFRLLGLSYIGKDSEQDAREAVRALLEVAPDYRPDPALDPPPFVALVEEMNRNTLPPPAQPNTASVPPPVSITNGFMGAIDLGGTSYSDSDDDSASGAGAELTLGYGFTSALAAYVQIGFATFSDFSDIGEGSLLSAGLGGRYYLGGGQRKLIPFLGGGAFYQSLSVEFDDFLGGGADDYSGFGGGGEGGVLYFFSPSFAIDAGVRALFSSITSDAADRTITTTTFRFGIGLSWSPRQNPR